MKRSSGYTIIMGVIITVFTWFFLSLRPMFGRGAGGVGKSFDARQKIGVNDVRQRLGGGTGKAHYYYTKK